MPDIRIQVGAALDANVASLTRPLVESFLRARVQIEKAMAGVARASAAMYKDVPVAARRAADAQVAAARSAAERTTAIHRAALAQQRRDADASTDHIFRVRQRYESQERRLRDARDTNRLSRGAGPIAQGAYSTVRTGANVITDIARGAGVVTNLGDLVNKAVRLQSAAVRLSNSAYQEGKGPRIDPTELMRESRAIGDRFAFDPNAVMEGLQSFTAKTGALDVGRMALNGTKDLAGLAEIAKATGTELQDMIGAAGEADKALAESFTDPKERAQALLRVLPVLAAQGKLGSVEFSDLAKSLGKVAAGASKFAGDKTKIVAMMGALAQFAVQGGGASSAAEAATSVAGFVNTLATPARLKQFKAAGVDVYNEQGQINDPFELIIQSLQKTKGDPERMKKLFANMFGAKPVESLTATFRTAGGGDAGEQAVRARMTEFMKGMSQGEIKESASLALATDESKIQRFNNELAKVGEEIAGRLLPQLSKLAPTIIEAIDGFAKTISWAAENPGMAITAAIVASIAKASLGSAVTSAITAAITGGGGAGILGAGAGPGAGLLGGAGGIMGGVAGGIAAGALLWGYSAHQDQKRWEAERRERVKTAAGILDDPRQRVNEAMRAQGIDVSPNAGIYAGDIRRFGATQEDSDKLELMRAHAQRLQTPVDGPQGVSLGSILVPPMGMGGGLTPMGGTPSRPEMRDVTGQPAAPQEMRDMLTVMRTQTSALQTIAANTAQGTQAPPANGPRMGMGGNITFGTPPPID